ncbi:MAG: adenylate/guanylate cyclase domain-containing protein [Mycobacteriales bacterium]|nr:adenylate/guanylate cyclase domain-containing protein [Mycobacteriales bacterium]
MDVRWGRERVDRCVAFVDLAGFTALTEAHGDDYAADVHDAFVGALARACEEFADVVCVKHLGDGALLVARSAAHMLEALRAGVSEQGAADLCLRVRAGVHTGPALRVDGVHGEDFLGHTVNVAARLCGLAAPGELLLSGAVRSAAAPASTDARPLGPRTLRHLSEPIAVWSLPLGTPDGLIDPVCHMSVRPGALSTLVGGREWLFCSSACQERFVSEHG